MIGPQTSEEQARRQVSARFRTLNAALDTRIAYVILQAEASLDAALARLDAVTGEAA